MYRCLDCGVLREYEGSFCPECGSDIASTVRPCEICGEYRADEYGEGYAFLPLGGLCKECFDDSVKEYFMEYLNQLELDRQEEFYAEEIKASFAFGRDEIFDMLKEQYAKNMQVPWFSVEKESKIWREFLMDGDPSDFSDWVIRKRNEAQV